MPWRWFSRGVIASLTLCVLLAAVLKSQQVEPGKVHLKMLQVATLPPTPPSNPPSSTTTSTQPTLTSTRTTRTTRATSTTSSPDFEGLRAAFCITAGEVRTFTEHVVHRSMQRNLIEAFGVKSNVFWHLNKERSNIQLDAARRVLHPVHETFFVPRPKGDCHWLGHTVRSQADAIEQCMNIIKTFEHKEGIRHHFIFRVRSDLIFMRPYPHVSYFFTPPQQPKALYMLRDWFWMVHRSRMEDVFRVAGSSCHEENTFEPIVARRWKRLRKLPIYFQCWPNVSCPHDMLIHWINGDPHWIKWHVLPFCVVSRMNRTKSGEIRVSLEQWGRLNVSGVPIDMFFGEDEADRYVDEWHANSVFGWGKGTAQSVLGWNNRKDKKEMT
ncbi:unnamed protein product [Durusdinium trenchii]|uniref:Glycosyl transferase CAP10 domain-containing protein n=1 Tax=Durusdinium trenchii TaxID=1381693 RepID=A0ABP0N3C5_9DINO